MTNEDVSLLQCGCSSPALSFCHLSPSSLSQTPPNVCPDEHQQGVVFILAMSNQTVWEDDRMSCNWA